MPDWFTHATVAPGVTLVTRPFASDLCRANLRTVSGDVADLQFDFGCGFKPLRPALSLQQAVAAVASDAHIDHIGGFARI